MINSVVSCCYIYEYCFYAHIHFLQVVIRGLHPLTDVDDIENGLATLDHKVVNVHNIIIKREQNGKLIKISPPLFKTLYEVTLKTY